MQDGQGSTRIDRAKQRLRARLLAQRRAQLAVGLGQRSVPEAADTTRPAMGPASPTEPAAAAFWPTGGAAGAGAGLATRLLALPEVSGAHCVAAYVALPGEPELGDLLARLRRAGTRVLLPVLRADLDLEFREYVGTLVPGALGTREPPAAAPADDLGTADAVIVPALAVDRHGRRLGRGGGSYDRALVRVAPTAVVIAVIHDQELLDHVPTAPHDRGVDIVVTPRRTLRCGPGGSTREHPRPPTG
ncbi:5-formyltetrahydrofolate cyclo-ligase [Frankia sp. AiPs1]|uniref:5-formyltetrahydrofolate cyclo-ligase n=1 Tax=Frankia sp. AiPa1 TaxID=573492 RepID=UPI00202B619E|nr:5-formyltetrahydrofolate cyclo-ligase [Frankia sp. AiPa1]MCL9761068.1 5-formyltetrahydrofolate cyclo-ligase [Frankia sp. AiPa1]